jgi:hypothetical protein
MRTSSKDQPVAAPPAPAIRHASDEAHATIVAALRANYEQAAAYAAGQTGVAEQASQEVARLTVELDAAERLEREARQNAQRGRDLADGYAQHLAAAGSPVTYHVGQPPYGEGGPELPPGQEAAFGRYNAAQDEQRAAENAAGGRP